MPMAWRRAPDLAAAALFALPLAAAWREPALPLGVKVLTALTLVATAARPALGVCLVAALLPLSPAISVLTGAPRLPSDMALVLALPLLVAGFARTSFAKGPAASWLGRPALLLAAVIAASAASHIAAEFWSVAPADVAGRLWARVSRDFFAGERTLGDVHRTVGWIAALGLAVLVERTLRADRAMAGPAARMAIAGAAALAIFSVNRVVELALRSDAPLALVGDAVSTLRFHPFLGDLNAAGSLQALFIVPAVWIAAGRREWWAWPAVALGGVSLWFTGSRAALLAACAGTAIAWALARRVPRRWWIGAAVLAVGALAFAVWSLRPGRATVSEALSIRWHLAAASLRVAATDPILGVGAGRLHAASAAYISPDLTKWYRPAAGGENAHNNFLQVLAESGILGCAAFIWLLAAATGPPSRWRAAGAGDGLEPGVVGGFVAFLLTCLSGHPLLIDYVRICFFLWVGLMAGRLAPPEAGSPGRVWSARFLAASLALIAYHVPGRVAAARQTGRIAMLSEPGATPADSVRSHRPDGARNARRIRARAGGGGGAGPAGA